MARFIVWALIFITLFVGGFMGGMASKKGGPQNEETKADSTIMAGVKYLQATKVYNDTIELVISSKGRVNDGQLINLISEVQGKIVSSDIDLKKGSTFKKGQLIAKLDNSEAELQLKARKSSFINLVANVLPDIKIDYSENYPFWNKFFELISVGNALPDLPPFKGSDQDFIRFRNFLASKNIMTEYYSIRSEEERFRKYYIFAPFDGSVIESFADMGTIINPGTSIVRIAKKDVKEIEIAISSASINKVLINADAEIVTEKGEKLKGRVVRKSDFINALTQSVSVFVEITSPSQNIYSGQYVTVNIKGPKLENVFETSRRVLQENNQVYLIKDSLLVPQMVTIEHLSENSAVLSNLENGDVLVTVPVLDRRKGQKVSAILK